MKTEENDMVKLTRIDQRTFLQIGNTVLELETYSVTASSGSPTRISVTFSLDSNLMTEVSSTTKRLPQQ